MLEALSITREKELLCELVDVLLEGRDVSQDGELSEPASQLLQDRRLALAHADTRVQTNLNDQGTTEAVISALEELVSDECKTHAELLSRRQEMTAEIETFLHGAAKCSAGNNTGDPSLLEAHAVLVAELHEENEEVDSLRHLLDAQENWCQEAVDSADLVELEREAALAEADCAKECALEQQFACETRRELQSEVGVARTEIDSDAVSLRAAQESYASVERSLREELRAVRGWCAIAERDAIACKESRRLLEAYNVELHEEERCAQQIARRLSLASFEERACSVPECWGTASRTARWQGKTLPQTVEEELLIAEKQHQDALAQCLQASVRLAMERGRARGASAQLSKVRAELAFAESRLATPSW
jgi:hypothetical protein